MKNNSIMKKAFTIGLFLLIMTTKVYAHDPEQWMWTTISTYGLYDVKNNADISLCTDE
jgi:uncharacterized GH25 family protein